MQQPSLADPFLRFEFGELEAELSPFQDIQDNRLYLRHKKWLV